MLTTHANVMTSCNTNSNLQSPVLFLGPTLTLLWDSILSSPLVWPCTNMFPTLRSDPYTLLCPPFCISFMSIAFTLPYLLFPAFPSVMPISSILLISEIPGLLSNFTGLSLYVHNTLWTCIVLCSLFVQTLSYISSTTPVCFLSLNLDLSST